MNKCQDCKFFKSVDSEKFGQCSRLLFDTGSREGRRIIGLYAIKEPPSFPVIDVASEFGCIFFEERLIFSVEIHEGDGIYTHWHLRGLGGCSPSVSRKDQADSWCSFLNRLFDKFQGKNKKEK